MLARTAISRPVHCISLTSNHLRRNSQRLCLNYVTTLGNSRYYHVQHMPTFSHVQINSKVNIVPIRSYLFQTVRSYAKGKDKPGHKKLVLVNENEMAELMDVEEFKAVQDSLLDDMKDEFAKQLTIHGASGALETLEVEFDGEMYPLQELAQIGRKNPQLVVLNLASLPDACQAVIKAIQESGMNLNPQQEGTTIYVPLPKVTREHREFLAKNARVIFVKYKTNFQSVQNRYIKEVRSRKDASQDLVFSVTQQLMKFTQQYITDAEKLVALKQKELLENK